MSLPGAYGRTTLDNVMVAKELRNSVLYVGNFLSAVDGSRDIIEDLADRFQRDGVGVVRASAHRPPLLRFADMVGTTVLRRREFGVAVVDLYSGRAFLWGSVVSSLLTLLRCPHVLVLRGGALPDFARRHPGAVRRCLGRASAVVAPSRYLAERLREYCSDVVVLPNPLDIRQYRYRLREKPRPSVVWMRSFHEMYGPRTAPRVIASLVDTYPDIHLTMVGPDKGDGSLDRTRQLAAELGVDDRISFAGGVPKSEVPTWLDSADVFLNTTVVDNTPVSVMEAMASGLCVVSTDAGGLPYLLSHDETAILAAAGDVDALTAAVDRVLREPGLASRLSANARREAESWDWSVVFPQWGRLLASLEGADRGPDRDDVGSRR